MKSIAAVSLFICVMALFINYWNNWNICCEFGFLDDEMLYGKLGIDPEGFQVVINWIRYWKYVPNAKVCAVGVNTICQLLLFLLKCRHHGNITKEIHSPNYLPMNA